MRSFRRCFASGGCRGMSGAESTNGMGRRGALLSKPSLPDIERIDAADPVILPDPTMNAVDHFYPSSGNRRDTSFLSRFGDDNKLVIR
jgi:hypothetical protein